MIQESNDILKINYLVNDEGQKLYSLLAELSSFEKINKEISNVSDRYNQFSKWWVNLLKKIVESTQTLIEVIDLLTIQEMQNYKIINNIYQTNNDVSVENNDAKVLQIFDELCSNEMAKPSDAEMK